MAKHSFTGGLFAIAALGLSLPLAAQPQIMAHRGGALNWPENTMHAFMHAEAAGVHYLEMDLQLTADGQLLVTHDEIVNPRLCDGPLAGKAVRELTLAQTRTITCGGRARAIYPGSEVRAGLQMPTLEEVFQTFSSNRTIRYFVETKMPKAGTPGAAIDVGAYTQALERLIAQYGLEQRVVVQSFDWRTLEEMHALNPRVRTCPLAVPKQRRDYAQALKELNATCIVLNPDQTTAAEVAALQAEGVLVFSGVFDAPADWDAILDMKMDAVFTNDPQGLGRYLRLRDLRE